MTKFWLADITDIATCPPAACRLDHDQESVFHRISDTNLWLTNEGEMQKEIGMPPSNPSMTMSRLKIS